MFGDNDYPYTGFRFVLNLLGPTSIPFAAVGSGDASFQEISGISVTMETEDVREGGENRFTLRLPKHATHTNLVLKRGVVSSFSELNLWCQMTMGGGLRLPVELKQAIVQLRDEEDKPVMAWSFLNAYPVKWEYSPLDATKNEIFVQTVELAHQGFVEIPLSF